jgi:hypothetical protein
METVHCLLAYSQIDHQLLGVSNSKDYGASDREEKSLR